MQCSPNPPRTKVYVLGLPCVGRLSVGGLSQGEEVGKRGGRACWEGGALFVVWNRHWFNRAPGPDPRGTEGLPIYLCFFVLCNRHWFNKTPGPDPRGTELGFPKLSQGPPDR